MRVLVASNFPESSETESVEKPGENATMTNPVEAPQVHATASPAQVKAPMSNDVGSPLGPPLELQAVASNEFPSPPVGARIHVGSIEVLVASIH